MRALFILMGLPLIFVGGMFILASFALVTWVDPRLEGRDWWDAVMNQLPGGLFVVLLGAGLIGLGICTMAMNSEPQAPRNPLHPDDPATGLRIAAGLVEPDEGIWNDLRL